MSNIFYLSNTSLAFKELAALIWPILLDINPFQTRMEWLNFLNVFCLWRTNSRKASSGGLSAGAPEIRLDFILLQWHLSTSFRVSREIMFHRAVVGRGSLIIRSSLTTYARGSFVALVKRAL